MTVDLRGVSVVDAHCHGLRVEDLRAGPARGWADRITLVGMCMASSATADQGLKDRVSDLTDSTIFALLARRWLANHLGVTVDELDDERRLRLNDEPTVYLSGLLEDQTITDLLVDDGYPLPPVDTAEFGDLVGARTHRIARIEPILDDLGRQVESLADLTDAFEARLDECAEDPRHVGYKSVIAYRSGLDVGKPVDTEAAKAFDEWKRTGLSAGRATKALRDRMLHLTCRKAAEQGKAVHIHSGAGDPDVILTHAHPTGLAPLIAENPATPIVLIHTGFPWIEEAAYLAGMYPNAHIELSLFSPWTTLDLDRGLSTILGLVPASKVMYGSDEASEPEVLWLGAKIFRPALERVLSSAVDRDLLTHTEAERIGRGVLGDNARRLHGLPTT